MLMSPATASAQCAFSCGPPPPQISADSANTAVSAEFALLDLGTHFLHVLGDRGSARGDVWGTPPNPQGGGASEAREPPRYRGWAEGYGLWSRTDAKADFAGDRRRAFGGVAGLSATIAPGFNLGLSIDQGHTKVDVSSLPQRATLDLTQVGLNASWESGPWAMSAALVHGFGNVDATRDTAAGTAFASYDARLWGAIAELSYYRGFGTMRVIPKIGLDWVQTETAPYGETGGLDPVAVPGQTSRRTRAYAGLEIGNTWIVDRTFYDLAAYGRFIDIVSQETPLLQVTSASGPATPRVIQGAFESQYGFDAGVMASVRLSELSRLYIGYEGRFRDNFQAHGGNVGVEVRW
jgi:uncharacterized protein with beta-barrel porin domain